MLAALVCLALGCVGGHRVQRPRGQGAARLLLAAAGSKRLKMFLVLRAVLATTGTPLGAKVVQAVRGGLPLPLQVQCWADKVGPALRALGQAAGAEAQLAWRVAKLVQLQPLLQRVGAPAAQLTAAWALSACLHHPLAPQLLLLQPSQPLQPLQQLTRSS